MGKVAPEVPKGGIKRTNTEDMIALLLKGGRQVVIMCSFGIKGVGGSVNSRCKAAL